MQRHPKAKEFRRKTCPNFDMLEHVINGTIPTGTFATTSGRSTSPQLFAAEAMTSDESGLTSQSLGMVEIEDGMAESPSRQDDAGPIQPPTQERAGRRVSSPAVDPPSSKRRRVATLTKSQQIGSDLVDSIQDLRRDLCATDVLIQKSLVEATEVLLEDFSSLEPDNLINAVELLEDPSKAQTFLRLPKGFLREKWLMKYLQCPDS